jgi:hypothetical protein
LVVVDFKDFWPNWLDDKDLAACAKFAFDWFLPRMAEPLLGKIDDYLANNERLLEHTAFHDLITRILDGLPESLFNAARVAKTQDEEFLHRLIPLVSRMANHWPEGLTILAEYCADHPDRTEIVTAHLSTERKEQLNGIPIQRLIAQGDYGEASRMLANHRKRGDTAQIPASTIALVVEREFSFDNVAKARIARHVHRTSDLLIFLLCNRGAENDLQLAWTLYREDVAAGGKTSPLCTQMVLQGMERSIDPQAPRSRSEVAPDEGVERLWSQRFLALAETTLSDDDVELALSHLEVLIVLAAADQTVCKELEDFALRWTNIRPEIGPHITAKVKEVLDDSQARQQLLDKIEVELRWNSSLTEAKRWFDGRELKVSGLRQGEFEFRATNPDDPSSYNSFSDSAMAIKMAEGWAVNPHGPLEQTFAILASVMARAAADTEKRSEKTRRHAVSVMRAVTDLVAAVRHSPSEDIRNRDAELTAFLTQSADRATLFKRAFGEELPDERPVYLSDKT